MSELHPVIIDEPDLIVNTPAISLLDDYLIRIRERKLPQLYTQRPALNGFEIGPGLVTVIGSPPGSGKTALVMQVLFDTLEFNPETKAVLAVTDTGVDAIFRRQLTRMTGIPSHKIRFGNLTEEELRSVTDQGLLLRKRLSSVSILTEPSIAALSKLSKEDPGLLIVDYIQQFATGGDLRVAMNKTTLELRRLAQAGWGVIAVSATKRSSDGRNDSKDLGISSFRESGSIEYDADAAYVLKDEGPLGHDETLRKIKLECVKNRHDSKRSFELLFDRSQMEFSRQIDAPSFNSDFENFTFTNSTSYADDEELYRDPEEA